MVYIESEPKNDGKKVNNIWWDNDKQELVFDVEEDKQVKVYRDDTLETDDLVDYKNLPIKRIIRIISKMIGIDIGIINTVYGGDLIGNKI